MRFAFIAFAAGAAVLQLQAELPRWPVLAALALAGLAAAAVGVRGILPAWIAALGAGLLGFAWAGGFAQVRMAERLAPDLEGRDLAVTGVVASLPQPFERGVRFELDVERADVPLPPRVLVSWYTGVTPDEFQDVLPVRPGERWRFTLRLKRPRATANPHAYDWEVAALERGLGATGYVRPRGERARLDALVVRPAYLVERAREAIRTRFRAALPDAPYAGVLIALAVGDQRAIEAADWQTFTRTGVGHLMSISGLHVTMIAGMFAWLVHALWRRSERLVLALPARKAAACAGVVAAAAYCLLAGFAVPAQRTLYMLAVVAIALLTDRAQSSSRVLAAALALVVLVDPWAVIAPGFWLSFGAVALMFYVAAAPQGHWLARWGRTQWAITVGLAPLTLALFQQVSLVSPLANAVAIPVVSLVVTPLALLAAVLPIDALAALAHAILAALMRLLDVLAQAPAAVWSQHAPIAWTLAPAALGVAWLLAPRGVPGRSAGLVLLLPLFAVRPPAPPPGTVSITFLDVGQGLATVVRTAHHALVYDAGPAYSVDADAGNRVVVPYLRATGVTSLDAVVITHHDNDHAGGAAAVMRTLPPALLLSSLAADHPSQQLAPYRMPCYAGQRWTWDGVAFEMLYPTPESYDRTVRRANWRSCVLRISAHGRTALLTGDIEARDEQALLAAGAPLAADLLLVPHHGSRTSSTPAFVAAVDPRVAVFTVGYRNRFGHPRADVAARYADRGVHILRTDRAGAIVVTLDQRGITTSAWREAAPRYWRATEPAEAAPAGAERASAPSRQTESAGSIGQNRLRN
jgi:competence protein ComEC